VTDWKSADNRNKRGKITRARQAAEDLFRPTLQTSPPNFRLRRPVPRQLRNKPGVSPVSWRLRPGCGRVRKQRRVPNQSQCGEKKRPDEALMPYRPRR
jgi:hypothetical protein